MAQHWLDKASETGVTASSNPPCRTTRILQRDDLEPAIRCHFTMETEMLTLLPTTRSHVFWIWRENHPNVASTNFRQRNKAHGRGTKHLGG
ncbi:hypothetical protein I2750_05310 [Bacillus sp. PR5]|nr:hypothetical protein [Bacillus sp. PR5]